MAAQTRWWALIEDLPGEDDEALLGLTDVSFSLHARGDDTGGSLRLGIGIAHWNDGGYHGSGGYVHLGCDLRLGSHIVIDAGFDAGRWRFGRRMRKVCGSPCELDTLHRRLLACAGPAGPHATC